MSLGAGRQTAYRRGIAATMSSGFAELAISGSVNEREKRLWSAGFDEVTGRTAAASPVYAYVRRLRGSRDRLQRRDHCSQHPQNSCTGTKDSTLVIIYIISH